MPTDLLVLAGNVSEMLEERGLIACGRREDGATRIDFWTRTGQTFRYDLISDDVSVEAIVAACLAMAGIPEPAATQHRSSHLN